jgi:hypothetical protein
MHGIRFWGTGNLTETLTAAVFSALLKDAPTTAISEACLQQAIRAINLEGLAFEITVKPLTGAALSLTGTYTSTEIAAIIQVAIAVYSQNYKNSGASSSSSESLGLGILSRSNSQSSSNSTSASATTLVSAIAREVVLSLKSKAQYNYRRAIV